MQFRRDGTSREFQGVTDVRSGYVNVQSLTGVPLSRLENETEAFGCYNFYARPWMPVADWNDIIQEYFPGCDGFSMKELAKGTPYSDWRSMKRAITLSGSLVHFVQDGPVWATAQNSFDVGIARVIEARQETEQETYFKATLCGSSPIR